MSKKWFKFHSDLNQFELGFLNSREYSLLFILLHSLSEKGNKIVSVDRSYLKMHFQATLSYSSLTEVAVSFKNKLTENGWVGDSNKALFSSLELVFNDKTIQSISVGLHKNKLYLVNKVAHNYTAIEADKFHSLSCFGAKVVYCWIRWFYNKDSFFIKKNQILSILGIDTKDRCNLVVRFNRIIKALQAIGYNLVITKEKKGADRRSISALSFKFAPISKDDQSPTKSPHDYAITPIPLLLLDSLVGLVYDNADKSIRIDKIQENKGACMVVFSYADKPFDKLRLSLLDFTHYLALNGFIKQDNAKTKPTITPTLKNAHKVNTEANETELTNFENIVLTSPKHFDYKIISIHKGSLYYEIKAFCDLKKKHELIKLLVAEYNNPLNYFFKQGYKFKCYQNKPTDADFEKYLYKVVSLIHNDSKYGDITSYLKIMALFKRYDNKIQVELQDMDKPEARIKPFLADNEKHLNAWFNKYQFGSY